MEVAGERLATERIVVATGSDTDVPPIVGMYQGRIAVADIAGEQARADYRAVPRVVFCDELLENVSDVVAGACSYCAKAFGVRDVVEAAGIPLLADYQDHPSLRGLVAAGYAVVTF